VSSLGANEHSLLVGAICVAVSLHEADDQPVGFLLDWIRFLAVGEPGNCKMNKRFVTQVVGKPVNVSHEEHT
jgi:hypothetical protein